MAFVYDTVEYKPNKTVKKLYKAVSEHVETVEFRAAENRDLVAWICLLYTSGPCSEVYYDRGPEHGCGKPGCTVGCECDRYIAVSYTHLDVYKRQV